jgi:hypothetical protein
MHLQSIVVALLVASCSVYALWIVMPGAARRALAVVMLRLPLPAPLARPFTKALRGGGGCGCAGCDAAPASSNLPKRAVVTVHRRR